MKNKLRTPCLVLIVLIALWTASPCAASAWDAPADGTPTVSMAWFDQILDWLGLTQDPEPLVTGGSVEILPSVDQQSSGDEDDDRGAMVDPNG